MLNSPFTTEEISKCIKSLKDSISAGIDNILNEYIKYSESKMLAIYVSFSNWTNTQTMI